MIGMSRCCLVLVVFVAACRPAQRIVGEPSVDVSEHAVRLTPRDKVDILFMVDDSPSMSPKQQALRQSFPSLLQAAIALAGAGLPASYHIGVVTSDLGAGPIPIAGCNVGGDGGVLRVAPAPYATDVPAACAGLTLGGGLRFIDWDSATGQSNVTGADVANAFSCMATVGDRGCGFESQLESVYRALRDPPPENADFLRDDALLVVVLITDEDDCSAPADTDLFDSAGISYGSYGSLTSFRCTQFGVACAGRALDGSPGTFTDCAPRPAAVGGKLLDVDRYIALFTADRAHGGLKDDPSDVVLVSLAAPPSPLAVQVEDGTSCWPGSPCPVLGHSCVSATDPQLFGDPAVRIHTVLSASPSSVEASICAGDYGQVLDDAAALMGDRMQPGCLPGALVERDDPQCTVTLATPDGSRALPSCRAAMPPCWDVAEDASCAVQLDAGGRPEQLRLILEGIPPGASASAQCLLYDAGGRHRLH